MDGIGYRHFHTYELLALFTAVLLYIRLQNAPHAQQAANWRESRIDHEATTLHLILSNTIQVEQATGDVKLISHRLHDLQSTVHELTSSGDRLHSYRLAFFCTTSSPESRPRCRDPLRTSGYQSPAASRVAKQTSFCTTLCHLHFSRHALCLSECRHLCASSAPSLKSTSLELIYTNLPSSYASPPPNPTRKQSLPPTQPHSPD